jgi:hypothetical protein
MSKWPMRCHFLYLRFNTFPMTPRTPQWKVFWALPLNSKHSGVSEDSKSPTLEVLGFTPTLGQSGVATIRGKVVASPESGPWWVKWVQLPMACPNTQGCSGMWTNHVGGLFSCRFKLDLLVPLPSLILGLPTWPSTPF